MCYRLNSRNEPMENEAVEKKAIVRCSTCEFWENKDFARWLLELIAHQENRLRDNQRTYIDA